MRSVLLPAFGAAAALALQGTLQPKNVSTPAFTPEMAEVLSHMRILEVHEPGMTTPVKVLRIGGVNVQILNENTASDHPTTDPWVKNGLGNLVLGWNTPMSPYSIDRSGSHNLVLGLGNGYTGTHGIVSGQANRVGSDGAVLGGSANTGGVVIGAVDSYATGSGVVLGGEYNGAGFGGPYWPDYGESFPGYRAVVVGGRHNYCGGYSVVVGGSYNSAGTLLTGSGGVTIGGTNNSAEGGESVAVGGSDNSAAGSMSVVGGGFGRSTSGQYDWAAGSLYEDD